MNIFTYSNRWSYIFIIKIIYIIYSLLILLGDLYQRQPLLPSENKVEKWGHGSHTSIRYDDEEEEEIHKSGSVNGVIKINMPPPVREEPRFPQERCKTFVALLVLFMNFLFTLLSLALVHDRVPNRETYGPLPDVFLDSVPALDWALDVSEYIIIISVNSALLSVLFHKHR